VQHEAAKLTTLRCSLGVWGPLRAVATVRSRLPAAAAAVAAGAAGVAAGAAAENAGAQNGRPAAGPAQRVIVYHPMRRLLGALLLPGFAAFVGRVFLRSLVSDTFRRNVLAGCLIVVAKDIASIAYEYGKLMQRERRRVMSYNGPPDSASL